jgi:hypothetical protein
VISLVWPCGVTNHREQATASDYFLSARGYNINELEDATPENFMNLKSFNSHEHTPFPPPDLKSEVDSALIRHKWFNLVLHSMTNDDGAIGYAYLKNIWVAPIGTVIKYILQRDRFVLSGYNESGKKTTFAVSRLAIPPSVSKNFEEAFDSRDLVTIQVDIDKDKIVQNVSIDGEIQPFYTRDMAENKVILVDAKLDSASARQVEVSFLEPYTLLQNYPNPFSDFTFTEFRLAEDTRVTLEVYSMAGQKIATILSKYLMAGSYKVKWDSGGHPAGTYILRLKTEKHTDNLKISIVK